MGKGTRFLFNWNLLVIKCEWQASEQGDKGQRHLRRGETDLRALVCLSAPAHWHEITYCLCD
jgi:hypothetical protein